MKNGEISERSCSKPDIQRFKEINVGSFECWYVDDHAMKFMRLNAFLPVGMFGDRSLDDLASSHLSRNSDKSVTCLLCGKISRDFGVGKAHLESIHFPSESGFDCQYCGKTYKTRNSLSCHISQQHRNKWSWIEVRVLSIPSLLSAAANLDELAAESIFTNEDNKSFACCLCGKVSRDNYNARIEDILRP